MDETEYGSGLGLLDKLRTLAEWAPLLNRLQVLALAEGPHDQAIAIIDTLQWAAGKSSTEIDDEALAHIEAVLQTDEGKAFFGWIVEKLGGEL